MSSDGKSYDQSEGVDIQEKSIIPTIEHVHFGIFFDGTNNNMVQQAYFHTFKGDGNQVNMMLDKRNLKNAKASIKKQEKAYKDAISKIEKRKELQGEYDSLLLTVTGTHGPGSANPDMARIAQLHSEM